MVIDLAKERRRVAQQYAVSRVNFVEAPYCCCKHVEHAAQQLSLDARASAAGDRVASSHWHGERGRGQRSQDNGNVYSIWGRVFERPAAGASLDVGGNYVRGSVQILCSFWINCHPEKQASSGTHYTCTNKSQYTSYWYSYDTSTGSYYQDASKKYFVQT